MIPSHDSPPLPHPVTNARITRDSSVRCGPRKADPSGWWCRPLQIETGAASASWQRALDIGAIGTGTGVGELVSRRA
jgi:hypothetical protein